jgi:hypothetical protein
MTRQLVIPRLASQLQRVTEAHAYTDAAVYYGEPTLVSVDEYGQPTYAATGTTFACSFTDKPKMELWQDADIQAVEAEIRFTDVTPTKGGRIKITKRFGDSDYADKTFEIIGIQNRGTFGYVCALRAVSI